MIKKRWHINWDASELKMELNPLLKHYEQYLRSQNYRDSTIDGYCNLIKVYLKFLKTDKPTLDQAVKFREDLMSSPRKLKPSSVNNYYAAIKLYHKMNGEDLNLPLLKVNSKINFYYTEDEILKMLSVIKNIKHLAMIATLFYCLLRASDLCNLNMQDLNIKELNLYIRDGKRGKSAVIPIPPVCGEILKKYLQVRPSLEVDGEPLFFTDYGNRWERLDLYRMVVGYKNKAGIHKTGGCHMLRHSAASILIKNGCDIATLKELMRHEHLETTARYLTVLDSTKRSKLEKYLVL
jgi:integrase/recombinase XerD